MDEILANRYAAAFIKYAEQTLGFEKAVQECKNIKSVFTKNPGLLKLLKAPGIGLSEKSGLIDRALGTYLAEESRQFLKLLLKKGRIDKIIDILEYVRINYSHRGRAQVLLKTSYALDLDIIGDIKQKLEKKMERQIKLYIDLDGSLLGGVRVASGDTLIIDGSVRRRIEELRKNLHKIKVA